MKFKLHQCVLPKEPIGLYCALSLLKYCENKYKKDNYSLIIISLIPITLYFLSNFKHNIKLFHHIILHVNYYVFIQICIYFV